MRAVPLLVAVAAVLVGCGSSSTSAATEADPVGTSQRRGTTDARGVQTMPNGTTVVRDDGLK